MQHSIAMKRDPNGEKFTLTITLEDGRTFTLSGLHVSTTETELDNVVAGALRYAAGADAPPPLPPEKEEVEDLSYVAVLDSNEPVIICQAQSLKQWHPSACGYHAIFNVRALLLGKEHTSSEVDFWALVFFYLDLLQRESRWAEESTSSFTNGILDEAHMEFLIDSDPVLRGRCSLIPDPQMMDIPPITQPTEESTSSRHGYLFACSSHWISAAWTGRNVLVVMDSHNKELTRLHSAQDSADMALLVVENYRAEFCAKMSEVEQYKHHPHSLINSMYDLGVPKYWKGKLIDSLYWTHRPAQTRVSIMYRELESIRAFLMAFRGKSATRQPLLPRKVVLPETSSVFTNLTAQRFPAYVRREENLEMVDRSEPATMQNRKRAPLDEVKGDAFDRQRAIPGFDQSKIESQICLVVGTGGIGMNVALTLSRLGVHEICLVDYDTYDASNLTRQCLGTKQDVGESKTSAAVRNIQAHNLRTKVRALEANAITQWDQVVRAANACTVVFNCCDAGKMLDFALNSLCKELQIPYCSGQSFGWKFMSEFYTSAPGLNCAFCEESTQSTFSLNQVGNVLKRLPYNLHLGSVDEFANFFAVDGAFRIDAEEMKRFFCETSRELPAALEEAALRGFLQDYHEWAIAQLLPGKVSSARSLTFCAWPKQVSTRYVGSWVCPCLACGVFCVSHWSNYLTSANRNPPTTILFNMDDGMTAEEQMGYEFQLHREDRSFSNSPSRSTCRVCQCAAQREEEVGLFFGTSKVWLRPVPGEVSKPPLWDFDATCNEADKAARLQERAKQALDEFLEPFIPALAPNRSAVELPQTNEDWPRSFAVAPLLKTSEADAREWPGAIQGLCSGVRSAIVFDRGVRVIRLKGCGNNTEAFPLEVKGDNRVSKSLRGCMFEETCARELYMTDLLLRSGIPCGNKPLGFFRYSKRLPQAPMYVPNPSWKWELEETEKFCGVFETLGEKRLGDSLLAGLELLLFECMPLVEEEQRKLLSEMQRVFASRESDFNTATHVECGMQCLDFSIEPLCCCGGALALDNMRANRTGIPLEWLRDLEHCGLFTLVLQLAKQLGRECGEIMRAMQVRGVCWGTFPDEMGIHCNAHANNLVVVFRDEAKFLAAVDLDFAFTRDSFVENAWQGKDAFFPKDFDGIVHFEQTMGMKTSLAGCDFSSTGVTNASMESAGECFRLLKSAFRDTVVFGYEQGLRGEEACVSCPPNNRARSLIKLALFLSA